MKSMKYERGKFNVIIDKVNYYDQPSALDKIMRLLFYVLCYDRLVYNIFY